MLYEFVLYELLVNNRSSNCNKSNIVHLSESAFCIMVDYYGSNTVLYFRTFGGDRPSAANSSNTAT